MYEKLQNLILVIKRKYLSLNLFFKILLTVNYDISTAKELLLLTSSQTEQKHWVSHLLKRIPKHPTLSPPPVARNSPEKIPHSSPQVSPRPSPKSSPRMSHRGAVKIQSTRQQPSSGKPRWETHKNKFGNVTLFLTISFNFTYCMGVSPSQSSRKNVFSFYYYNNKTEHV